MFKFDFVDADAECNFEDDRPSKNIVGIHDPEGTEARQVPPLVASTVDELIDHLPHVISYSPLRIPISDDHSISLLRRDLFDARFQLISGDDEQRDLEFIDAPSDLVPGRYEGGLKTWECSVDLAGYLYAKVPPPFESAYKILEIGCGTAIPSLCILRNIFNEPESENRDQRSNITFHLQDFNSTVLRLVTLPNIILTWYASLASTLYRASQSLPVVDISEPGELELTPELITSFVNSLQQRHIELKFFSGAWTDLEAWIHETHITYDLALTSETIYRSASQPTLVSLFMAACPSTNIPSSNELQINPTQRSTPRQCLVAAKVIYFGVGGGIDEFIQVVKKAGGHMDVVLEKNTGVGRRIISISWGHSV